MNETIRRGPSVAKVIASCDWGFTNPGCLQVYFVDYDGRMFLIHEVYRAKRTIDWWIDQAKALHKQYGIDRFICDPAEPGFIEQFKSANLPAEPATNDIIPGIHAVQQRLQAAGDERPRLMIYDGFQSEIDPWLMEQKRPTSTVQEFDSYVWALPKAGHWAKEKPVDEYNHGLDALRYAVMSVDNPTVSWGDIPIAAAAEFLRGL
jgi:hypothetical protein